MIKHFKKTLFCISLFILISSNSSISQEFDIGNPKTYKYFKIYACTDDDDVFTNLQFELNIKPKYYTYTIVVNVIDTDTLKHYIVFGEENDIDAIRFSFYKLSKETRDKLIDWSSVNKYNLQFFKKKE